MSHAPTYQVSKRLYLLRHAKSSWARADLADIDRPLDERGLRATAVMAAYCGQIGLAPDLVLCSPARRTRMTWEGLRGGVPATARVEFREEIYEAGRRSLLSLLRATDEAASTVLLIGHNPGLHDLAVHLSRGGGEAWRRLLEKYPTGGLAAIRFDDLAWSALGPGRGVLESFVGPKHLV